MAQVYVDCVIPTLCNVQQHNICVSRNYHSYMSHSYIPPPSHLHFILQMLPVKVIVMHVLEHINTGIPIYACFALHLLLLNIC